MKATQKRGMNKKNSAIFSSIDHRTDKQKPQQSRKKANRYYETSSEYLSVYIL